ncbi:MAG: hypothetical protein AAF547_13440 [Actinomycetota bacterium]
MGRDILEFTGPTPLERLGLPAETTGSATTSPSSAVSTGGSAAAGTDEPDPPSGSGSRGVWYLAVTVVGLAAAAAVGYWAWSTAGRPDLVAFGRPIGNPDEVLAAAEDLFRETAEADGVTVPDGAACFFGQGNSAPVVLCGPTWLGVSPDDEPWLQVTTSYRRDGDRSAGEVGEVRETRAVEPRSLTRPDGRRPIDVGPVVRSPTGLRRDTGARIVDPEAVLAGAEEALLAELGEAGESAGLSLSEDATCFLQQGPDSIHGVPVHADVAWCGPVRAVGTDPDDVWAQVRIRYRRGETYGSSAYESARASLRARSLPEGAVLFRPDGRQPGDPEALDRPPVAADYAEVVEDRLPIDAPPGPASLVTERYRIDFSAFDRTVTIGTGARSFTAPPGHELVLADIEPPERFTSPRGSLLIDGVERPLPRWRTGEDGGTLVIAVPAATTSVEMRVENDGRPQTISLLDGSLSDGYPLALYRPPAIIERPLTIRVELPVGDALVVEGTLTGAEWSARDAEGAWLPEGLSELELAIDAWSTDRPCCELSIEEVLTTFTLIDRSQGEATEEDAAVTFPDQRDDPSSSPRFDRPTFQVPEDLTAAVLRVDVDVVIVESEAERTVRATTDLELELP